MGRGKTPEYLSDREITELFAQDREKAFRELVRKYARRLYLYIRRMTIDHQDTDDVLQNSLVKAWENLATLKRSEALARWLYRIATNETMSFLSQRAQDNRVSLDELSPAEQPYCEQAVEPDDRLGALTLEAIQSLPRVQQAVFTMKHFEQLKYSDISRITGTSEGALKASYHIAVEKIRAFVQQRLHSE